MADVAEPEVKEPEVKPETKEEPKEKALDPTKSLSSQTKEIEELVNAEPEKDKPEEKPAPDKKEVKEPETPADASKGETATEEPDETPEEPEPPEPAEIEAKELPNWQKYVLDNLPEIQTVGHVGKAKDKTYTVKRNEDLPADFEFADKATERNFLSALAGQEVNARDLLKQYQNEEQQQQLKEYQDAEAVDIQNDITKLQKEGVIDKFKYDENSSEFNDDPAVKEANAIYDLYKKTNDSYMKEGRTYRITFEDAAYKYLGMKSKQSTPKPDNQKRREEVAAKVSGEGAAPGDEKRGMPAGSSMQDVYRMYKLGRI